MRNYQPFFHNLGDHMKKHTIIIISVMAIIMIAGAITYAVTLKPKEFKTTFTITYNNITLERASELEKIINQTFHDACTVDVELENVDLLISAVDDSIVDGRIYVY